MSRLKTFVLLLHSAAAAAAASSSSSSCLQGPTFPQAVVSPAPGGGGILRVPGATTLAACVAASCRLPGSDLAWLLAGRCFALSCRRRTGCRPRERPGADSVLAFLRRGEPAGGRWRDTPPSSQAPPPSSQAPPPSPEAPGDLEDLKDLALLDRTPQDFSDPDMLDLEYSEGTMEEQEGGGGGGGGGGGAGGGGGGALDLTTSTDPSTGRDGLNQSGAGTDPEAGPTESSSGPTRTVENLDQDLGPGSPEPEGGASHTDSAHQDQSAPPPTAPHWPSSSTTQTEVMMSSPHSGSEAPPTTDRHTVTSDLTTTGSPTAAATPPDTAQSEGGASEGGATEGGVSEGGASNRAPVAVVGPDQKWLLPLSSLSLDGRGSSDDQRIVSYHWEAVSGPPGLKLEDVDQAVATATGLRAGRYTFRLSVCDQQGATDSASLTVRLQDAAPVAHASGSHALTLPNNSLVLRGSVTGGDQSRIQYLWVRDRQSPAAGDVLYDSDTRASLYLANLVEGTYLFQLRVLDAQGRSSSSTATVEVRPEPGGGEEVELEMLVSVSQVSVSQRDTVVRQLAALLHVLDADVRVRALQGHSHLSTVLRFSVGGPSGPVPGSRLVSDLRNQLLREKSDYLLFRVLRVDTVLCLLLCSGRGQCDPVTKDCSCDPLWTQNLIRRYLGDGESNCEWRVLYVILTSVLLMVLILTVSWTFICCCRRRRETKVRKKTKYTILDNMDEQERVELRPKFSLKHRSTEQNSSLMMSESELDSDQDSFFSRDRPVRSRNRVSAQAAANGGTAFG